MKIIAWYLSIVQTLVILRHVPTAKVLAIITGRSHVLKLLRREATLRTGSYSNASPLRLSLCKGLAWHVILAAGVFELR